MFTSCAGLAVGQVCRWRLVAARRTYVTHIAPERCRCVAQGCAAYIGSVRNGPKCHSQFELCRRRRVCAMVVRVSEWQGRLRNQASPSSSAAALGDGERVISSRARCAITVTSATPRLASWWLRSFVGGRRRRAPHPARTLGEHFLGPIQHTWATSSDTLCATPLLPLL